MSRVLPNVGWGSGFASLGGATSGFVSNFGSDRAWPYAVGLGLRSGLTLCDVM